MAKRLFTREQVTAWAADQNSDLVRQALSMDANNANGDVGAFLESGGFIEVGDSSATETVIEFHNSAQRRASKMTFEEKRPQHL
jgi:hypothetical protein